MNKKFLRGAILGLSLSLGIFAAAPTVDAAAKTKPIVISEQGRIGARVVKFI